MKILSIVTRVQTAARVPTQDERERTVALISELVSGGSLVDTSGTRHGLLELAISIAIALPFVVAFVPIGAKMLTHLRLKDPIEDRLHQPAQRRRLLEEI